MVGHVLELLARRPLVVVAFGRFGIVTGSGSMCSYGIFDSMWLITLIRERFLSSLSTVHQGASGMSVCTNISSLARE